METTTGKQQQAYYDDAELRKRLRAAGYDDSKLDGQVLPPDVLKQALDADCPEADNFKKTMEAWSQGGMAKAVEVKEELIADVKAEATLPTPKLGGAAYHGLIARIARTASWKSEAVESSVMQHVMVRLGTIIGSAVTLRIGDTVRPLVCNALIVGPTSKGRKGTSTHLAAKLFKMAELLQDAYCSFPLQELGALSTGEGLIDKVRDGFTIPATAKTKPVDVPGVVDKRLLCDVSEFGSVLAVCRREGATIGHVIRDAFDCKTLTVPTRNNPIKATGAHVSIIGSITDKELTTLLTENDKSNGVANRFPMYWSARSKLVPIPTAVPDEACQLLAEQLAKVIGYARLGHVVTFSPAARVMWEHSYRERAREALPPDVAVVLERRDVYILIHASLYALADFSDVIEVVHLEAALAWSVFARDTAMFIFSNGLALAHAERQNNLANHIVAALAELAPQSTDGEVPHNKLTERLTNNGKKKGLTAKMIVEAIEALLKDAPPRISKRTVQTSGRPLTLYRVLPAQATI